MNVKYFGQYLLEKGYVNKDQLLEGIKYQKAINLKIGVLAIDKGFMTAAQVNEIVGLQKAANKQFGVLAIEKKYITNEQIEELLSIQKSDRIFLGEALLEKGFLTLEQLETYLREYKKDQQKADSEINTALSSLNPKYSNLVKNTVQIFQNLLVRMVDEAGKISNCVEKNAETPTHDYLVSQKIFGDSNCIIGIGLQDTTLCYLSSQIFKKEINEVDAYAEDGVKEFVNIGVGHLCAALSNEGIITETAPPLCGSYSKFKPDLMCSTELIVTILMTNDEFNLHFFLN